MVVVLPLVVGWAGVAATAALLGVSDCSPVELDPRLLLLLLLSWEPPLLEGGPSEGGPCEWPLTRLLFLLCYLNLTVVPVAPWFWFLLLLLRVFLLRAQV